jgi:hypothetical protein
MTRQDFTYENAPAFYSWRTPFSLRVRVTFQIPQTIHGFAPPVRLDCIADGKILLAALRSILPSASEAQLSGGGAEMACSQTILGASVVESVPLGEAVAFSCTCVTWPV